MGNGCRTLGLFIHTGLSDMLQNQGMTLIFFPHICHVCTSVLSMVLDITDHTDKRHSGGAEDLCKAILPCLEKMTRQMLDL